MQQMRLALFNGRKEWRGDSIGKIQSKLKMAIEKRQQLVARSDKAAEEFEAVAAE